MKNRVSVLVNNYNCQQYVVAAIESILNQSVPPDEIIIVDDCSTDKSPSTLKEKFEHHEKIKLILKDENQGQLSCFNEGFAASSGQIVCFLDADDLYKETYIENVLNFFEEHRTCDFLMCGYELFGSETASVLYYEHDRDLGVSQVSTLWVKRWLGSITSTLAIRRNTLDKILPISSLEDWKTRADDCLVYGSSMVGARKFYLASPLVKYRIHGKNNWFGNQSAECKLDGSLHERKIDALIMSFASKDSNLTDQSLLNRLAKVEFLTIPRPRFQEFKIYASIIKRFDVKLVRKNIGILFLLVYFLVKGDRERVNL